MKITGYNPDFTWQLIAGSNFSSAGGDLSGTFPGPLVTGIWGVSIACNTAPTTGQVLTALSPTLIGWASPSNSAAFGSNSTRVSATPSAGASSSNARADHIHDGIGTITASASNTLDRGTFNLRAGSNVSFALTDSDGSGGLDTVTVNASIPGGGVTSIAKSGSTALTGAVTLTGGTNVTLTQSGNDISIASTGGGGGGVTFAYAGYNTIGGSQENVANSKVYCKKITLANDCLLSDIECYVNQSTDNVFAVSVALAADNAGVVGNLLSYCVQQADSLLLENTSGSTFTPAWIGVPIGRWVTAGDYWICAFFDVATGTMQLYYDGSGSDRTYTSVGYWFAHGSRYTQTNSTRTYSMRAVTVR